MTPITDAMWELTDTTVMPGGMVFPLRCTIIRLEDGLWVHSPIAFTDEQAAAIDAQGTVRHLVAPSRMHDLHIAAAAARWPDATVYAPGELLTDRELVGTPLDEASWSALDVVAIHGATQASEFVFLHRDSGTLLVTDLVFNFGPAENLVTGLLRWAIGCRECLAASRSWRWVFADDTDALAESTRQVLALEFDRLVPCHGGIVHEGANQAMHVAVAGRLL